MAFLRSNFGRGYLATGITVLSNQIIVRAGHTLTVELGSFRAVIWDHLHFPDPADDPNKEIITASYSGVPNVYDILRAQENTIAAVHDIGQRIGMHYTAGVSMDDLSYGGLHGLYDPDYHSIDIVL